MANQQYHTQNSYDDFLQLWTSLEDLSPDQSVHTMSTEYQSGTDSPLSSSLEDLCSQILTEDYTGDQTTLTTSPQSQVNVHTSGVTSSLVTSPSLNVDRSPQPTLVPSPHHSTPSNTNYPGAYGFQVTFSPPQKETKSTSWTYSVLSHKLYVKMASSCPVQFHTSQPPPEGSMIRAMAVFSKAEHAQEVVTRCPNHISCGEHNHNHPAPSHLVRCEHQHCQYLENPSTGRHSVLTPYQQPQAGCPHLTYLYQFMCLGSCVGGPNRRPLQIVFTLEKDQLVLGRAAVDIRICACPARDKRLEEKSFLPQTSVSSPSLITDLKPSSAGKKRKLDNTDTFTITVHGRDNFEMLRKIRDSLELMSSLSAQQIDQYKVRPSKVLKSCTQSILPQLSPQLFCLPEIIPSLQMVQE